MAVPVVIKLQIDGGKVVTSELQQIGRSGERALKGIDTGAARASASLKQIGISSAGLGAAFKYLASAATAFAAIDLARKAVDIADAWTNVQSKLRLAAGGLDEAATAQQRLFEIAQQTRAPFEEVVQTFSRLAPAFKQFGVSVEDQFKIVKALGDALVAGGASASEASAGLLQFGQALGSGVLQGDELRSLLENFPVLARGLAEAFGVSIGQLKQLGSEGRLTSDVIIQAVLRQSQQFAEAAGVVERTFSGAMTQLQNDILAVVGETMGQADTTRELTAAVDQLRAVINSPDFAAGLAEIASGFASVIEEVGTFVSDVSTGIEESKKQIAAAEDFVRSLLQAFSDLGRGAMDALDGIAAALNNLNPFVEKTSDNLRAAKAEMSDFMRAATKPLAAPPPPNFAGAGTNFRASQEIAPATPPLMIEITRPRVQLPEAKKTGGSGGVDRAQRAAEQALKEAQRIYAADETAINDMLRELTKGATERDQFVQQYVQKLSPFATEDQVAAAKEYAGELYKLGQMQEYAADQEAHRKQIEQDGLATTREFATVAEVFAQRMMELNEQLRAGAISQDTYAKAAKAASDEAAKASADANKQTLAGFDDTYSQINQLVDTTYQGISAGLANMITSGEADFESFLKGMANSIIQSGIQSALQGLFGGGTAGGGGLIGSLFASSAASAHGNAFDRGEIVPFATGGIVTRPTIFPMARGAGLMGEAGPEAVLPLKRLSSGNLGVSAEASSPQVNISVQNYSKEKIETQDQGGGNIKVTIGAAVASALMDRNSPANRAVQDMINRSQRGR